MTPDQADSCLGLLVGGTPGWTSATDETLVIYHERFRKLDDVELAQEAVNAIIDTWTNPGRPPWATVRGAYDQAMRRKVMDMPALAPVTTGAIPPSEGRKFAAAAYAAECRKRDPLTDVHIRSGWRKAEPNWDYFDAIAGIFGADADEDERETRTGDRAPLGSATAVFAAETATQPLPDDLAQAARDLTDRMMGERDGD